MFLGLIPARRGDKRKNLWSIGGLMLIEWAILAAKRSKLLTIICSTDDDEVKKVCDRCMVHHIHRTKELSDWDRPIQDVVLDVTNRFSSVFSGVVLLQPTSPFTRPQDINSVMDALGDKKYQSAQTVARFPHNYHAFNQRKIENGNVLFYFEKEREKCFNKQKKPELFKFGNVVATRVSALSGGVFALPSYPVEIPHEYAIDIDSLDDIPLAEWYLSTGRVEI